MSVLKPLLVWLLVVGLAVAGLAINHSAGYDSGFALAKAQGEAALEKQGKEHEAELRNLAEFAAIGLKKAADDLLASQAYGVQLAADLGKENARLRTLTDTLNGDIQRVTNLYRRALDAQPEPQPPAVFTAGYVRVWNSALFGTAPADELPATGTASGRADATRSGAYPADDLIVGVSRADLLANHVRNGEGYASCRAQLNKLIEWNANHGRK